MSFLNKSIAGLAGAIAVNVLHEILRKTVKGAPHINEIGEEIVEKSLKDTDFPTDDKDKVYAAAMTGDLISNALYYASFAPGKSTGSLIGSTLTSGLLAGAGAVLLPEKLGLNDEPTAGTDKKKLMTVGYYLLGAVVAAGVYRALEQKKQ